MQRSFPDLSCYPFHKTALWKDTFEGDRSSKQTIILFVSPSVPFWLSEPSQSYFLCLALFGNRIKSSMCWFSLFHSFLMGSRERQTQVPRYHHRSWVQVLALSSFVRLMQSKSLRAGLNNVVLASLTAIVFSGAEAYWGTEITEMGWVLQGTWQVKVPAKGFHKS